MGTGFLFRVGGKARGLGAKWDLGCIVGGL